MYYGLFYGALEALGSRGGFGKLPLEALSKLELQPSLLHQLTASANAHVSM